MGVVGGIDEAGYGPILGPLVVSAVAFRTPWDPGDVDLWETLSAAVARNPERGDERVTVADSKALVKSRSSLARLETGVLALLRAGSMACGSLREALASLGAARDEEWDAYPWYRGRDVELPRDARLDRVERAADLVGQAMGSANVTLVAALTDPMHVAEFNAFVARSNNKAMANATRAMGLLERLWRAYAAEGLGVAVDKLGGRKRYRTWLLADFPDARALTLMETSERSTYDVIDGGRRMTVSFEAKADSWRFAVALASMISKYVRELFMGLFNDYWRERAPGLKPTAGYFTDGRRFLAELADRAPLDAGVLDKMVRSR